ncbi:Sir2 family NAD-dependent protein deacetylase [Lolliginicoccus suaedae]|uniref:Sir2 family NAD-dependent protein deacetylase n=1 Tax=Lolliginicoccus suaedae TaxID=2605429 RepID=UPI0011F02F0B|nr:Sir2 family NAD-dependent protein deacetylase [Lolliginicoccus suaedae]
MPPDLQPRADLHQSDTELDGLARAIEILAGRNTVALTGAGLSTDSGIPDYRSPSSPPRTPMTIAQFLGSREARQQYWARNHIGWRFIASRSPNPGHRALATLEDAGVIRSVITQNVDLLHTRAGHRDVINLHGTYRTVICLDCGARSDRAVLAKQLEQLNPGFARAATIDGLEIAPDADALVKDVATFRMVDCALCGGILKPDIVFFGESVPRPTVEHCYAEVDAADAVLVAGSSLTVMSGLRFVRRAARRGIPIIIVNRGGTRGDELASARIDGGCSETLGTLAEVLL